MRRGLYRVHGIDGRPDDVRVEDDGIEFPIEEGLYRTRGYQPSADDLPWQEEFFQKQIPADDAAGASDGAKAIREQARQEFRARFGRSS
jgi:hypothetical protein